MPLNRLAKNGLRPIIFDLATIPVEIEKTLSHTGREEHLENRMLRQVRDVGPRSQQIKLAKPHERTLLAKAL